jgi:hypothetical protein
MYVSLRGLGQEEDWDSSSMLAEEMSGALQAQPINVPAINVPTSGPVASTIEMPHDLLPENQISPTPYGPSIPVSGVQMQVSTDGSGNVIYTNPVTGQVVQTIPAAQTVSSPAPSLITPSPSPTPAPASTVSAPAGQVNPIMLPNGVAVNPSALTAAQQLLTPAQLQAQLYPSGAAATPLTAQSVPFSLSTWLSQSSIISGFTNQSVAIGGVFFCGLLAIILNKKKGKR